MAIERLFPSDCLSKRERVDRTLALQPVDRVALHDQLSFNPGVIQMYTGKPVRDFDYSLDDICHVIRHTLDACFPPVAPRGTDRIVDGDGFVIQYDNWTTWTVERPFSDVAGARRWLALKLDGLRQVKLDPAAERERHRVRMLDLQRRIGDTVIIDYTIHTGFCDCWSRLGLDLFCYLQAEAPQLIDDYMHAIMDVQMARLHAIASPDLSPVVLIAEDFATKRGPIFSSAFLARYLWPHVRRITQTWHQYGIKVLYHSDGNWKQVIPALIDCGVHGFYCLEPSVGMDIVQLKNAWPNMVWAGGVDGVDLMERGTPEQVSDEVRRHICETRALETGGMFVGTSSEVNPPIQPGSFRAMVDAVGSMTNPKCACGGL